jgi:hypothetical protein
LFFVIFLFFIPLFTKKKRLFESNQDLKKYFEKFKDMDNESLFKSQALINHATSVMESIDTTVTELDDADKTHNRLKKLGLEHKARGITESFLKVNL